MVAGEHSLFNTSLDAADRSSALVRTCFPRMYRVITPATIYVWVVQVDMDRELSSICFSLLLRWHILRQQDSAKMVHLLAEAGVELI